MPARLYEMMLERILKWLMIMDEREGVGLNRLQFTTRMSICGQGAERQGWQGARRCARPVQHAARQLHAPESAGELRVEVTEQEALPLLPAAVAASCWSSGQLSPRSAVAEVAALHPRKLPAAAQAMPGCDCGWAGTLSHAHASALPPLQLATAWQAGQASLSGQPT